MFSKKKDNSNANQRIILGMIMLADDNSFVVDKFLADLKDKYRMKVKKPVGDNAAAVFSIGEENVAVAHMPVPVPWGDIESTAQYAYNWLNALADLKSHKSHLIVSLMGNGKNQVERFSVFTRVICSLLRTTNAIGVYKGNQSLLIPKEQYMEEAGLMSDDYLPLNLWIYFGLRDNGDNNSGYTYGLIEFNKTEMEIVDSARNLEDIRGFLFNMAHYVLEYDVVFEDGQTCGLSVEQRIPISFSKGVQVEGNTFKLGY